MKYKLIQNDRTVADVNGYPEAVLTAQALSVAGPVAIDGVCDFKTRAEWDEWVEELRRLVQPI